MLIEERNNEPQIGDKIIVSKTISSGWYDSHTIFEILEVKGITPKKRELKLSNGTILKPDYQGKYKFLIATDENLLMATESLKKNESCKALKSCLNDIERYIRSEGTIYKNLSLEEINKVLMEIEPLMKIAEMKKEAENERQKR